VGIFVGDEVVDDSIFSFSKFANPSSFAQLLSSGLTSSCLSAFIDADTIGIVPHVRASALRSTAKKNRVILSKFYPKSLPIFL